ncbi:MAG TPA: hypothetical protein VF950_08125 [Planctomycetota bacterium]
MNRAAAAVAVGLLALAASPEEDAVRMKNGRVLAGKMIIEDSDKDGFKVRSWDSDATVYVKWTQIPDAEKNRLLGRSPDAAAAPASAIPMIDGIFVVTTNREVTGVLVREDAGQYLIKTKDAKSPLVVPKNANVLRKEHPYRIKESDAYSSEEMVEAREKRTPETDYAALLDVAKFAAGLRLFERAKGLYQKAGAAPNAKKDEITEILAKNEVLIKEEKADTLLAEINALRKAIEFAKAVEAAKKLLAEYAETDVARQNAGLVGAIEKDAKDFEVRKAEYLAREVPDLYKSKRSDLIHTYASPKYKIGEVKNLAGKIDEEVVKHLASKLKSTADEIKGAWDKRELKPRTVSFGDGTWVALGVNDGVMDTDAKGTPKQTQQGQGQGGGFGFGGFNGGNRGGQNRQNPQAGQPVPLGKKLQTSAEWWAEASTSERRNFVEAWYALNSSAVKREETKKKKCSFCKGEGLFKGMRQGFEAEWKCGRCHGAKDDDVITYS